MRRAAEEGALTRAGEDEDPSSLPFMCIKMRGEKMKKKREKKSTTSTKL